MKNKAKAKTKKQSVGAIHYIIAVPQNYMCRRAFLAEVVTDWSLLSMSWEDEDRAILSVFMRGGRNSIEPSEIEAFGAVILDRHFI